MTQRTSPSATRRQEAQKRPNDQPSLIELNNEPVSNCMICRDPDNSAMVQCDRCDAWFHFDCVGVDENVAEMSWNCTSCNIEIATQRAATGPNGTAARANNNAAAAGTSNVNEQPKPHVKLKCNCILNADTSEAVQRRNGSPLQTCMVPAHLTSNK